MGSVDIPSLAEALNTKAHSHPIGRLQEVRTELHGFKRQPGHKLFSSQTITDAWAFHHGGRSELQFNIGFDGSGGERVRYGIAFSFETSQRLPEIDILIPKVRLFNDFLRLYPDLYAEMRMWHWQGSVRSSESPPGPIPPELVSVGVFVFLGKLTPVGLVDHEEILAEMDRLLPLYEYVESEGRREPVPMLDATEFEFQPGCCIKPASTTASYAQQELNVNLRHNVLQRALYQQLVGRFGADSVRAELPTGIGTSIDLAVRQPGGYLFYEIKTSHSPRACIREAIGQLLEYSFWPRSQEASRLIIVGESPADDDVREYCRRLNQRFSLPIQYEQISP